MFVFAQQLLRDNTWSIQHTRLKVTRCHKLQLSLNVCGLRTNPNIGFCIGLTSRIGIARIPLIHWGVPATVSAILKYPVPPEEEENDDWDEYKNRESRVVSCQLFATASGWCFCTWLSDKNRSCDEGFVNAIIGVDSPGSYRLHRTVVIAEGIDDCTRVVFHCLS